MFIILDELQNHLQVKNPVRLNWLYVTFRNYVVVNLSFVQYSLLCLPRSIFLFFCCITHLETDLCELPPTLRSISNVFRWWKMLADVRKQGMSELWLSLPFPFPQAIMCWWLHLLILIGQPFPAFQSYLHIIASSSWPFKAMGADSSVLLAQVIHCSNLFLLKVTLGPFSYFFKCAFWFLSGPCLIPHSKTDVFPLSFHFCLVFLSRIIVFIDKFLHSNFFLKFEFP